MLKRLLERLDALDEAAAAIRAKVGGKKGELLDGLILAKVLLAVDAAANKLHKLDKELQAGLFEDCESA